MKERGRGIFAAVVALVFILLAAESFAQRGMQWKGSGGWGMSGQYGRMYDPKTVETISGDVVSIERIEPMKGMSYGVHLTVKTNKETLSVHLGPAWYIENQDVKIAPKDTITITGSRIMFQNKPALIAREVKKGDEVMMLRDETGFPVWSGWRRR
jgi:hypothetical protein